MPLPVSMMYRIISSSILATVLLEAVPFVNNSGRQFPTQG